MFYYTHFLLQGIFTNLTVSTYRLGLLEGTELDRKGEVNGVARHPRVGLDREGDVLPAVNDGLDSAGSELDSLEVPFKTCQQSCPRGDKGNSREEEHFTYSPN